MYKPFRERKFLKIFGIISVFVLFIIILAHFFYSIFPANTKKTNANILIVEGWLPSPALESIKDEFQNKGYDLLIVTGLNSSENYYAVSMNGYLIFYPGKIKTGSQSNSVHSIEVKACSQLGGENRAHFNCYVNNTLAGNFFAGKLQNKYGIIWKGKLEDIDSIMIQFDNNEAGKWGDRNLFVKEIIIDHEITIPYKYNSVYNIGSLDSKKRIINNFSSNAEQTRLELISMGVDSSRIIAVPGEKTYVNRTLKSALAFCNWLKKSKCEVKGINIISSGPHAKRSLMIYHKVLGKNYKVGIIVLPYFDNPHFPKIIIELREFFGLIYYWVILKFY
jgi:uncharacterized SAM-binding protein YcdF (DUF218 family)